MARASRAHRARRPTAGRAAPSGSARSRSLRQCLIVLALVGCSAPAAPVGLVPSSGRLPAPPAVDPAVRGAGYLNLVAAQLQGRWSGFLEDCRLRLPAGHPLNAMALVATFDLAIAPTGALAGRRQVATSGNGDFDTAVADVLSDASPLPPPPPELRSDDELVHVRWQFARDRRQAGAATARVLAIELPLAAVVDALLERGELARAARRIVAAPAADPDRAAATQRVMVAALREALDSPNGAARRAAVEACGRARVHELAAAIRGQLAPTADPELRPAAIAAAGALGDRAAAPALVFALRDDLSQRAPAALARVAALVAIGHAREAGDAVRAVLEAGPNPTALAALALAPVPALAGRLTGWSADRSPAVRGAVCAALPAAAPAGAPALILRGLRDPDATVRATCADAAARQAGRTDAATLARVRELTRDRDRSVRARAVAAVGQLDPVHPVRAAEDPAAEVRAAFAATASVAELRVLVTDRAPEVRAAALIALGGRDRGVADQAAGDGAAAVREAAAGALDDVEALHRLSRDDSPGVASAALVRLTALHGRAALTAQLLEQLAAAPSGSLERARIALAWLLAS